MRQENLPDLPVVIVGKDRTRMTCAVIDALKEHIKNSDPYFICVSDRSQAGHDEVIENHLEKIGVSKYLVQRTLPEEDRYGWGAAMNIGIASAFDVCREATCALVVDNDWILQKDLDIDKYLYAFAFSSIAAITFKHIYSGTNVTLEERQLSDGSSYLLRSKGKEPRYSFTAELGCMLITRRMYEKHGRFKENCRTDETEWEFCDWYNGLSTEFKNENDLWFATDKDLFHTELNGEGHVFTHVGIVSQHEGKHKWDCPDEYKYLSDDKEDERICREANQDDSSYWEKNKVLFATNFIDTKYTPLALSLEIIKAIAGADRVYVSPPTAYGRDAFFDIFRYAIEKGYKYIIYVDADCFIVNQENLIKEFNRFLNVPESIFSGCSDGGMFCHRCGNPWAINPFLLFARVAKVAKYMDSQGNFHFGEKTVLNEQCVSPITRDSWRSTTCAFKRWRETHDIAPIAKDIEGDTNYYIKFWLGHHRNIYVNDEQNIAFEPYYDIFIGCQSVNREALLFMHGCDYPFSADWSGICSAVFYFGEGEDKNYDDKNKLICIHTWFSRVYLKTSDTGNDDLRGWQKTRIERVVQYCNSLTLKSDKIIPKRKKFISVYAIAKNEASVAARWYDCVKEADEVCVLDTGSTDDTVKILRDLGAKVTVKTYDDWSFAVARNDSMKLVSPESEILFTLDLDETIAPGWRKKLEDAWIAVEDQGKKPVGVFYKYIWSFYPDGREMQSFAIRKIHANGIGQWRYRCHELLCDIKGTTFFLNNFVVEHHQNRQTSRSSYIGLLEKDAREMPENDRSAYYYARELMYAGRWEDAIVEFKRHLSLRSAAWHCERASSMRNIAYCYNHLQNADEYELWLWKAAEEDKTNREATYFLGKWALEQKDYRTAVQVLARCVAITKPSLEYISMPIVWTASPWFLYAQALWWVNRWNEAVEASKKAMEIEPHNGEVMAQYENMKATRDKYAKGAM